MQDWFATWFNSPYYHILYKNRNEKEAENFINRLIGHLGLPKKSRALDLACGKGRHSLQLHKSGFKVIGIDLSKESITHAKQHEREDLEFFVSDMRTLSWSNYFDVVVNLFTSFGYFHNTEDDQKTISSVANALKPNGLFVFDFLNAVKVENNLVANEEKTIDGIRFQINREVENGIIVKQIRITDGKSEHYFKEEVDALNLSTLESYLKNAELTVVDVYGNYQLEKFNEQVSDRLIIIAKKPAS